VNQERWPRLVFGSPWKKGSIGAVEPMLKFSVQGLQYSPVPNFKTWLMDKKTNPLPAEAGASLDLLSLSHWFHPHRTVMNHGCCHDSKTDDEHPNGLGHQSKESGDQCRQSQVYGIQFLSCAR